MPADIDNLPEVSPLDMSDEDFNKLPLPSEVDDAPADDSNLDPDPTGDVDPVVDDAPPAEVADDTDSGEDVSDQGDADSDAKAIAPKVEKAADTPDVLPAAINYQEEYEKLTKPFKANGGEIQVKNTDEIMTLMQMGANYHKKMSTMKSSLKLIKLLERNDLLDESKLGYLIDLSRKDPAAIQKLVKESGIDPLDIDVASDSAYTPKIAQVSDVELQLDAILDDIQESPTYARTLQVVTDTWDVPSRNAVAHNPHIIKVINDQISSGIYDKVMSEVDRARRFGKLSGLSDFEAYKQVGDYLANQGLLQTAQTPPVKTGEDATAQKKKDEEKRNAQRKAAGAPPVKKSVAPVVPTKSGLLSMSDEEFSKLPATAYSKIK